MTKQNEQDTTIDLSALILGFSSAALHYLGESPSGEKGLEKNLIIAKQNIEIIELLKQKTKGNLTPEEDQLFIDVLKDLKAKFVEKS